MERVRPEQEHPPRRRDDLEARTDKFEYRVTATFCGLALLVTVGFVGYFWLEVIQLGLKMCFYWLIAIGFLERLFYLLAGCMWLYRKIRGLGKGTMVSRMNNATQSVKDFFLAPLRVWGVCIGRGPLFDLLDEETKQARRNCKSEREVNKFLTFAAGNTEETDETHHENLKKLWRMMGRTLQSASGREVFVSPQDVEYEPNPVMFKHLRVGYPRAADWTPTATHEGPVSPSDIETETTLDTYQESGHNQTSTTEFGGEFSENLRKQFSSMHTSNGPATKRLEIATFPCPECDLVFRKAYERNKHVNRTHVQRYRCAHEGCSKSFSLHANMERHKKTVHGISGEEERFKCSNAWCRIPDKVFSRKDNLERHMRKCG